MSVFLRWGVFGILGVAALLYAYNASKRMAEAHATRAVPASAPAAAPASASPAAPAANQAPPASSPAEAPTLAPGPPTPVSAACEGELVVAQRALDMRRQGAPLDRVLRMQEIAWQESAERRARLEKVATRWFTYEGDFRPETLRIAVLNDCQASPAP